MKKTACVLLVMAFTPFAPAQDAKTADRIKEIRKEIADLRTRLAALEAELAKLQPPAAATIGPAKKNGDETFYSFKIGDVGMLTKSNYVVANVFNEDFLIVRVDGFRFIVAGANAQGLSDGAPVEFRGAWIVEQPTRYLGQTLATIRPKAGGKVIAK